MRKVLFVLALILLVPTMTYAQVDPGIPGLDWIGLVAAAGAIMIFTNLVKGLFNLAGKPIMAVSGAMSVAWAISVYQDNIQLLVMAAVFCWGMATGVWKTGKILMHKQGTPSAKK